jgi:hypothetical protein
MVGRRTKRIGGALGAGLFRCALVGEFEQRVEQFGEFSVDLQLFGDVEAFEERLTVSCRSSS